MRGGGGASGYKAPPPTAHGQLRRFSEGDDPKVFEAKIQVHVIFTWVLSFVAGDVTAVLEAKILKEMAISNMEN